jgi:curli biogenesis system outer membrane secretion channel CsgG/outer membrane protein OmpA-like peptidoglycan-associated protein
MQWREVIASLQESSMTAFIIQSGVAMHRRRRLFSAVALAATALAVSGCATTNLEKVGKGEAVTVLGPPVRTNRTPLEPALAYLAKEIDSKQQRKLTIAVGDVKDYTGKYNINEGNAITQGGSLMVYSALGKLGGTVQIADRYDTNVAQMELSFLNQRVLGDGQIHDLGDGPTKQKVPWLPYYGGSITQSDYFITGGITELNYNVQSGGVQFQINQVGPQVGIYTENVGVDLQIVNTKTLVVEKTVSLEKQITGYQVGFNVFRFFGSDLYDLNTGNKSQEPLQLGVRSTLEEAVLLLVASVEHVPAAPALEQLGARYWIPEKSSEELFTQGQAGPAAPAATPAGPPQNAPAASAPPPAPAPAPTPEAPAAAAPAPDVKTSGAELQNGRMVRSDGEIRVTFDFGDANVTGADLQEIDRAAQAARSYPAQIMVLARANENWAPSKRQALTAQRVEAVRKALALRGVMHFSVTWEPGPTETGIKMDGSGYQQVATLVVSQ